MAITLTTSWQEVATSQKTFTNSTNWIKWHIDAKVGSPNVANGTIPIYTRLRSTVQYTGWSGSGYYYSLTYAQHTTSSAIWQGSDVWNFGNETILETLTTQNVKYDAGGTKTVTLTAVCQNSYHSSVNSTFSVDVALPAITTYYLDVSGNLDGSSSSTVAGYGYFDMYINGSADRTGVNDYNRAWIGSTTYEIKNIKATTGHTYNGVYSGSLSGTISAATTVVLKFTTNSYTITYNLNGGTNASGNPTSAKYGTTVTISNPTKTGYTFAGWSVLGGTLSGTSLTMGASNVTLTANWTPHQITFNYYANNGDSSSSFVTWVCKASQSFPDSHYDYTNGTYKQTKTGYTGTGYYGTTTSGGVLVREDYEFQSYSDVCSKYGVSVNTTSTTINIYAQWTIDTYTDTINHYAGGFKNGEGTNGSGNLYFLTSTTFTATYNSNVTYNSSKCTTIPKGYNFSAMGSGSYSTSWVNYGTSTTLTQPAKNCSMQYDYHPYKYDITYNLNGGTNHADNPSTYTILYGVTFKEPTREGHTFKGWTLSDGTPITGINEGKNATFSSADDLYTQLSSRTIGGVSIYANWDSGQASVCTKADGVWKKGKVFVKKTGTWVKATKIYIKANGSWVESIN